MNFEEVKDNPWITITSVFLISMLEQIYTQFDYTFVQIIS